MHRHERRAGPLAAGVDRAGEHAFAGAAFSANEDRGVGGGRLERHVQGLAHGAVLGLQINLGHDAADLFFQLVDVRLQLPDVPDAVQDVAELVGRKRLGKIIEGPSAHGLDRRLNRGERGDNHNAQPGRQTQHPRQQFKAKLFAKAKVQQRRIERAAAEQRQGLFAVAGVGRVMSEQFQRSPDRAAEARIVVNYQDVHIVQSAIPVVHYARIGSGSPCGTNRRKSLWR